MALTSIFRILNQFRQIGTSTNNALNRVGRYYEYRQAIYGDFYQVLNAEIVSLYLYLKDVISGFTTNFRKRDT